MTKPRVVCLVGPTGVGKSAVALRLAEQFKGEIINADSRQVFEAFPIITAQPSQEEQATCPHRLYGFLKTDARFSAGAWGEKALAHIERTAFPLLVGGTGLYLRAFFDGIVDIPPIPDDILARLTETCRIEGSPALHRKLQEIDPAYAARIHENDRQRIVRALCVYEATGKTFSWWHGQTPPPREADVLRIGLRLPLDTLTPLLARRIDLMLEAGALDEARAEYASFPDGTLPGWSGIGCRELHSYLSGALPLDAARELWIKNTRAYAKRQLTWFNADSRIQWFAPDEGKEILAVVKGWHQQEKDEGRASGGDSRF